MTLLQEYKNQSTWRDWERYLIKLPLNQEQTVYDLGCSIGIVSKLLSTKVKKVVGFDNDKYLLDEANKEKQNNCQFILENIFTLNPINLQSYFGIKYPEFCSDFLDSISDKNHMAEGCVQFSVGIKS